MISSGMGFVGIVLMLSAAAVSCAAEATARGKIGVNPFVGLRVGYVTHSSGAWRSWALSLLQPSRRTGRLNSRSSAPLMRSREPTTQIAPVEVLRTMT